MKMRSKTKISVLILILLVGLFLTNERVDASTATLGWSGANEVTLGSSFTEEIVVTGIDGNVMGIGGQVSSSNPSCVQFDSIDLVDAGSDAERDKFVYLTMSGTNKNFTIVKVNFKAVSTTCTATINVLNPTLSFTDGNNIKPGTISKTITVKEATPIVTKSSDATLLEEVIETSTQEGSPVTIPEPSDATLKSLDVSRFTLITVPNNIDGLDVEAVANDPEEDNLLESLTIGEGTLYPLFDLSINELDIETIAKNKNANILTYLPKVEYIDDRIMDIIMNRSINYVCDLKASTLTKK